MTSTTDNARRALAKIISIKDDVLGDRTKPREPFDCPQAVTDAFDRGCRMAFYRCAEIAREALAAPHPQGADDWRAGVEAAVEAVKALPLQYGGTSHVELATLVRVHEALRNLQPPASIEATGQDEPTPEQWIEHLNGQIAELLIENRRLKAPHDQPGSPEREECDRAETIIARAVNCHWITVHDHTQLKANLRIALDTEVEAGGPYLNNGWNASLRATPAPSVSAEEYSYATRLAFHLWEQHWKVDAPEWQPLPDLLGVLTQLDNMVAGLVKPALSVSLELDGQSPDPCSDLTIGQLLEWLRCPQFTNGFLDFDAEDHMNAASTLIERLLVPAPSVDSGNGQGWRTRPTEALQWARETFGPVAVLKGERTLRFIEEAIELGHALGLDANVLPIITTRVYAKEPGDVPREIGQAQMTLECLAENNGYSAQDEAAKEFDRVKSIPKADWSKRHAAKVAIGMALSDPGYRCGGDAEAEARDAITSSKRDSL